MSWSTATPWTLSAPQRPPLYVTLASKADGQHSRTCFAATALQLRAAEVVRSSLASNVAPVAAQGLSLWRTTLFVA